MIPSIALVRLHFVNSNMSLVMCSFDKDRKNHSTIPDNQLHSKRSSSFFIRQVRRDTFGIGRGTIITGLRCTDTKYKFLTTICIYHVTNIIFRHLVDI